MALFARRRKLSVWSKAAAFLWPASGFRRSGVYLVKRLKRLPATQHAIAAGVASGAAVSCLPLIGFHFLLAFALAWVVRGNMIAAAFGTAFGNPLTFPLIYATAYRIGDIILTFGAVPHPPLEAFDPDVLYAQGEALMAEGEAIIARGVEAETLSWSVLSEFWPTMKVLLVGGAPLALTVFLVIYGLIRFIFAGHVHRRERAPSAQVTA
ncbi:MAG: DUF2062 domain-containing protein [Rhodobacteraceae bacterium]|nr:MAG: DUF2062 domain-containing protein [Paracoccaceae bacterium]